MRQNQKKENLADHSRILKFRAWHTELKEMFSPEKMAEYQITFMPDGRGFVNISSVSTKSSIFAGDRMIPLQFTGLKDKNGKEIFDGDIVEDFGDERTKKGQKWQWLEVQWSDKEMQWICLEVDDLFWKKLSELTKKIAVIGNIFLNPELLTPKMKI